MELISIKPAWGVRVEVKLPGAAKSCKRTRNGFIEVDGFLPTCRQNPVTGCWEDVVNPRGFAYAKRNDINYQRKRVAYR